jgi:hypothetical protein
LICLSTFTNATMCHAPAVGSLNRRDSLRSSASLVRSRMRSAINCMAGHVRYPWQRSRARYRGAIDEPDQRNAQVSSIHNARVPAASPEQRGAGRPGWSRSVVRARGWRRDPACPDLLKLPEGAHEAHAQAEHDEQQQEGLINGGDLYHGIDKATAMPCVPVPSVAAIAAFSGW